MTFHSQPTMLQTLEFEDLARPQECEFVQDDNIQEDEEFTINEFDDVCVPVKVVT